MKKILTLFTLTCLGTSANAHTKINPLPGSYNVEEMRISPNGDYLFARHRNNSFRVWNLKDNERSLLKGHSEIVKGRLFTIPTVDNQFFVRTSSNLNMHSNFLGKTEIIDVKNEKVIKRLTGEKYTISPNEKFEAYDIKGNYGGIRIADFETGNTICEVPAKTNMHHKTTAIIFNKDSSKLFVFKNSEDGSGRLPWGNTVHILNSQTCELTKYMVSAAVKKIAVANDLNKIFFTTQDNITHVYDGDFKHLYAAPGEALEQNISNTRQPYFITLREGNFHIYEKGSGRKVSQIEKMSSIEFAGFYSNGRRLVLRNLGKRENRLDIVDTLSGRALIRIPFLDYYAIKQSYIHPNDKSLLSLGISENLNLNANPINLIDLED